MEKSTILISDLRLARTIEGKMRCRQMAVLRPPSCIFLLNLGIIQTHDMLVVSITNICITLIMHTLCVMVNNPRKGRGRSGERSDRINSPTASGYTKPQLLDDSRQHYRISTVCLLHHQTNLLLRHGHYRQSCLSQYLWHNSLLFRHPVEILFRLSLLPVI
jgi:hypothetical protein